jgi:hypothetical protein
MATEVIRRVIQNWTIYNGRSKPHINALLSRVFDSASPPACVAEVSHYINRFRVSELRSDNNGGSSHPHPSIASILPLCAAVVQRDLRPPNGQFTRSWGPGLLNLPGALSFGLHSSSY